MNLTEKPQVLVERMWSWYPAFMLQRRLGVVKSNTATVGDSMGDVGMFGESGCAILFNPWDDRPREFADHVIVEKDLLLVLNLICEQLDLPKP